MTDLNYHCPICDTKNGNIIGQLKYMLFDDSPLFDKIENKIGFKGQVIIIEFGNIRAAK